MFYCQLCGLQKRHVRNSNLKNSYFSRLCFYCRDRTLKSDALLGQPQNSKSNLLQPTLESVEGSQEQHSLITAFIYQDLPQILIHNFKYRRHLIHGKILLDHLIDKLKTYYFMNPRPDIVTNIPQTETRYFQRGFCHTTILSHWISKELAIPFVPMLQRQGDPKQQAGLNRMERIQNIRQSFILNQKEKIPEHSRVALIDDVITTGATTHEALRTLSLHHNIISTDVWCLAGVPVPKAFEI